MIGVEEIAPKSVRSGRLLVRDRGGFVWLGDDVGVAVGIKKKEKDIKIVYIYIDNVNKKV